MLGYRTFINNLVEKELEIIIFSLKFLKNSLKFFNQEFENEYKKWNKSGQLWRITNKFVNYLKFILSILTIKDKEKLKEIFKTLDTRAILKILYDIKAIDRKIQMGYPQLKEEFKKATEKFDKEIETEIIVQEKQKKEVGLESMSDLAYTVYCYLTGNDGSEAIKIQKMSKE